ncbi:MAG TPA: amidohydrolase family protein [Acidimicrobiales bacterium]|nr:amidohydrolase family protein [Acidimicrobiales bacterium]
MAERIDAHVHVYDTGHWPARWFDFVAEKWAAARPGRSPGEIRGGIEAGLADPGATNLLAQMDELGLDRAVILGLDWELGMGQQAPVPIEQVHETYAAITASSGGRILSFAGVDPRRPNATELLAGLLERGSRGLKLYPPAGFHAYDEVAEPLLELCLEANVPVAIHTGGTIGVLRPRFGNPLDIQDVQARYPGLKIWIAHSGLSWWWEEALAVATNGVRIYLELSGWQEIVAHDEERFVRMLDTARRRVGVQRLLFGSDHFSGPKVRGIGSLRDWYDWFVDLPARAKRYGVVFSDDEVDLILGENARECLGL